ncbi:t-SNARE affecting a late Golgi compartment protein 2 [Elasticomyces elasticus]|nr:t-SNARE affecting a late Golgi compartment protein 2 [Elasticomyces elasticus]
MSAPAFEDDGDAVIEMDLLPPRWLDIQDEVTEHLATVATQMKRLEQMHQKHILPGFDDEDVKRKEERDIENLTQEITRGFQACQKAIKRIDGMVKDAKQQGGINKGEETMANNLKINLATRVGEVSTLFRKKQAAYLKKLRSLGGLSSPLDRSSTPVAANPYTDPSLLDSETDRTSAQSTLLQTAQKQLRRPGINDTAIAQREREIEEIAQGIIALSNIFQELNGMVIDQGSMLDRIDYNVERMAVDVKAADKELTVATGYQRKSTKRMIILLLVLLVVGMFILLLVKPKKTAREVVQDPASAVPPARVGRTLRRNLMNGVELSKIRKDWRGRRRRLFDGERSQYGRVL